MDIGPHLCRLHSHSPCCYSSLVVSLVVRMPLMPLSQDSLLPNGWDDQDSATEHGIGRSSIPLPSLAAGDGRFFGMFFLGKPAAIAEAQSIWRKEGYGSLDRGVRRKFLGLLVSKVPFQDGWVDRSNLATFFFPTDYIGNKEYVFSSSGFQVSKPCCFFWAERGTVTIMANPLQYFVPMCTKMVGIQGRLPFATGAIFAEDLQS